MINNQRGVLISSAFSIARFSLRQNEFSAVNVPVARTIKKTAIRSGLLASRKK